MKSDEIVQEVKADVAKAENWIKRAWAWAWARPFKVKASVGLLLAAVLLWVLIPPPTLPDFATKEDVKAGDQETLSRAIGRSPSRAQFSDLEAKVNELEAKVQAAEGKLSEQPAKITTGSIAKKRKPAPVKSSASSWFDLP